jgi:hypothetical protein
MIKGAMHNFGSLFFKIAIERLEKNFVQWRTANLQLLLGADDITSEAFAHYLEDKSFPTIHLNSEKHKAKIDILDMMKYLTEKVDRKQLRTRLYYRLHGAAVKEMTDGNKIFGEHKSSAMIKFGEFVQERWYPLPSNTHFVEAGVKDAKLWATTKRDEMLRSIYAMVRSVMVHPCIAIVAEERSKKKLQGNQYMTSGVHGERKRKKDNGVEEEESSGKIARIQISGASRNSQIIQLAASAADINRNSSKYQETKKVMQRSSHFDQKRRSIKLEKFNDNKGKQRRENIIQKNSGIAVMPILRGMVSINKCTSNKWIPKIQEELTHRNVPIDEAEGLKKLKEKLLVHEKGGATIKKDDKWFKPRKLAAYQWDGWN